MKYRLALLIANILFITAQSFGSGQMPPLIEPGDLFPDVSLKSPNVAWEQDYLGINEDRPFALKQIQADVVLVEILSVYCPSCQRQSPFFNKVFEQIQSDASLKNRVKLIGIAAGNGNREIEDFKEKYNIRFPIIADPLFAVHHAIGGSRTPFTIVVRQDRSGAPGVVGYTHLGPLEEADQLITSIKNIMQMDVASVRRLAANQTRASAAINPIVTDNELQAIIETTFKQISASVQSVKKIEISQSKHLYTCLATQYGKSQRLFANVIARPPVCSDCHDIHFIYVFDSTGIVLEIVNLQLTKWGNEPWDAADMAKMRGRLIGRSLRSPFIFNPSVDAVSSATITSAMIFNSLSQGNQLLKALQVGGWL